MPDNFSTIEEIPASDSSMRVVSTGRIPHYLACDKYGNCAAIEFIDGKMVTHPGKDLPVKALANTSYDRTIADTNNRLSEA
jgi:penicillin V acylase-like amidase (Ntn superfamily)